ncbi:MAG TPA: DegV family protein [Dehalococcoidia bacterium]|nr:DegV family protein [Dehalococcoidia bacterium]
MPKVAVVTDSIACLTREFTEQYDIEIIPINFYVNGRSYRDWVDITPTETYELFLRDPDSFKTSAPAPEECLQVFRRVSQKADNILCITVSLGLSAVYNAALDAKRLVESEQPNLNIEIMDSKSATPSEGMIALAAARAAAENKELAEVISATEEVRGKVNAYVLLDTMRHVYRSGRIPKIASQIGSALNIRPILSLSEVVHFNSIVRNRKQGIDRILKMMKEKTDNKPVHAAVMHAYALDEAEKLKERVAAEFNCVELWLGEFSPVMGYACGTGTVGVAFYIDD